MRFLRKRKTDAEWVEGVRKLLEHSRRFTIAYAFGTLVFYACFLTYWMLLPSAGPAVADLDEAARSGFSLGIMLGAMAGLPLFGAIVCAFFAVRPLTGLRTERLMIRFYDELNKKGQVFQGVD